LQLADLVDLHAGHGQNQRQVVCGIWKVNLGVGAGRLQSLGKIVLGFLVYLVGALDCSGCDYL